jgi:pimeloyl-ACP methyl ester carboxylesterase
MQRVASGPVSEGSPRGVLWFAVACAAASAAVLAGCSADDAADSTQTRAPSAEESTGGASSDAGEGTAADATSETATAEDALPEPPGQLFDVDGHLMHLYCTGEGSPTVLLEAGLGDPSVNYWPLQEELAPTTRVCTYDRAGLGWSEPGPEPRTGEQIVDELENLLRASGEPGPYVLAGHSLGGLIVLMFAQANPDDVTGVVLIDSSHPRQDEALAEIPELAVLDEAQRARLESLAEGAEAGRIGSADVFPFSPWPLHMDIREQWAALAAQPHSLRTVLAEFGAFDQTVSQVGGEGSLGDIPLVVLAAGLGLEESVSAYDRQQSGITPEKADRADAMWQELQEDHLTRSTNARLVVAENSTHYIYFDEPEVVLKAIQDLTGRE